MMFVRSYRIFVKCGIFLALSLLASTVCFAADLEISVAVEQNGQFVKPFSKTVTVRQQPMPFSVVLTNRSDYSKSVYWTAGTGGMTSLYFEVTDESGQTVEVRYHPLTQATTMELNSYLQAGQSVNKTMLLNPDEWDNLPILEYGKVKTYQVRVIYENDGMKIYSDPYTLILDGR